MTKAAKVTPIFPAAAVARYGHPNPPTIQLDDLDFSQNFGSTSSSTDPEINVLDMERFAELNQFLRDCVADYLDNVLCYEYERFKIVHAWVNRTPEGGYQRMHFHGNSVISGTYYLQATPDNAPLMFERFEYNTMPYIAVAPREQTQYTANRVAFPVRTGALYLFPSNIKHGYETPNQGPERISLALNVMLSGIGLFYRM